MVQRFRFIGITVLSVLILTIVGAVSVSPAYADGVTCTPAFTAGCSVSNSGNIEVVAGNSGSNTITLSAVGGDLEAFDIVMFSGALFSGPPVVGCTSVLPTGAGCSFSPTQVPSVLPLTSFESSSLTITTSSTTPPGTYPVTVEVGFVSGGALIAPVFSIQQQQVHPEQGFQVFTTQFNLIVDPPAVGGRVLMDPLQEYALALPLLGILMVIGYGLVRRRTRSDHA
jgi:hypothetical protein